SEVFETSEVFSAQGGHDPGSVPIDPFPECCYGVGPLGKPGREVRHEPEVPRSCLPHAVARPGRLGHGPPGPIPVSGSRRRATGPIDFQSSAVYPSPHDSHAFSEAIISHAGKSRGCSLAESGGNRPLVRLPPEQQPATRGG